MKDKQESVTIRHPAFGTLYLYNCEYFTVNGREIVTGDVYNYNTPTGDGVLKEAMNFPVSCIKKEVSDER